MMIILDLLYHEKKSFTAYSALVCMSHLETHRNTYMCLDALMEKQFYSDLTSQRKILPVTAGYVVRG